MVTKMGTRIFFSHPYCSYHTPKEKMLLRKLDRRAPHSTILNPRDFQPSLVEGFWSRMINHFLPLVAECEGFAVWTFVDSLPPPGVALETVCAISLEKRVIYLKQSPQADFVRSCCDRLSKDLDLRSRGMTEGEEKRIREILEEYRAVEVRRSEEETYQCFKESWLLLPLRDREYFAESLEDGPASLARVQGWLERMQREEERVFAVYVEGLGYCLE